MGRGITPAHKGSTGACTQLQVCLEPRVVDPLAAKLAATGAVCLHKQEWESDVSQQSQVGLPFE